MPAGARARWFGSDIFERYTTEYTWYANQFGHFALGLTGAVLCHWSVALAHRLVCARSTEISADSWGVYVTTIGVAAAGFALYLCKEVADWLIAHDARGPFRIDERELTLDMYADAFFVGFGLAFGVGAGFDVSDKIFGVAGRDSTWINAAWDALVFALGLGVAYWLRSKFIPQKIAFDRSGLPFYFRLPSFTGDLVAPAGGDPVALIETFAEANEGDSSRSAPRCLVLHGARYTGKTSVAVGIGVAWTLRLKRVGYATLAQANELARPEPDQRYTWDLGAIERFVIDDCFMSYVKDLNSAVLSRMFCPKTRTVMVLGEGEVLGAWIAFLNKLVPEQDIAAIQLTRPLERATRRVSRSPARGSGARAP